MVQGKSHINGLMNERMTKKNKKSSNPIARDEIVDAFQTSSCRHASTDAHNQKVQAQAAIRAFDETGCGREAQDTDERARRLSRA